MFALPYVYGVVSRLRNRLLHTSAVNSVVKKTSGRPPNILIYTGKDEKFNEKFQKTKELLKQCLHQDKYVIYQLKHDSILQEPWTENTELLILTSDHILDQLHEDVFDNYVKNGGKLLSFSNFYTLNDAIRLCDVISGIKEIHLCEKMKYEPCLCVSGIDKFYKVENEEKIKVLAVSSQASQPVVISMSHGEGMAILSTMQISMDTLVDGSNNEIKELLKRLLEFLGVTCGSSNKSVLTSAYLLGDDKGKDMFLRSIQDLLTDNCFKGNDINIIFTENKDTPISNSNFPVLTNGKLDEVSFNLSLYKEHLKTKHLGQLVIYTDVITSTQTILNGIHCRAFGFNSSFKMLKQVPEGYGLVLIARQQTVGKGRGGNSWLSPDGCLSFSFPLYVELDSNLGQRLPFVQHIAALAVVDAVRGMDGYEGIDIWIKWPNDIYFGKDTKIGGILVNSAMQGKNIYAVIGIGVNLANSEPTTCINDMIEQRNMASNMDLRKLSREQLLARILNEMEDLVKDFQQSGPNCFREKYYLRWLHSGANVNLGNENGEMVIVTGLDDMGYLSVINGLNEVQSVQPDGNSFDMMRNLITIKTRK